MATAITPVTFRTAASPAVEHSELPKLLIVESDRLVREACREAASSLGWHPTATDSIEHALWFLGSLEMNVVLLDWNIRKHCGSEVLRQLKQKRPDCDVVVLIHDDQVQSAVEAIREGAFDCLSKPFGLKELKVVLERVSRSVQQRDERKAYQGDQRCVPGFGSIIGCAPEMEKLYRIIGKAAQSSHPVLILGESGTGKELVAKSIHFSGPLQEKPFIPVDCGSLVPTLIESELFGHVKGAFTGAVQSKQGLLSLAQGGTVFLDEIGELPLDLQSKLLRAIQEREVRPVGCTKSIPINVRILAATNRDLEQAVGQGTFRRDLYFRLNVLTLRIPPLRIRRQDIRLLATSFLEREALRCGRAYQISDEALAVMTAYDWPGNVRELENCVEQCCALNSGPAIHARDLH
jgi:DNA-binding NtrC family response regulator